jgi:C-terminal processing protease CtpA/Prc
MAALNALQNRHTWVMHPSNVVSIASAVSDYPLNEIFRQEVVDVTSYWQPIYNAAWNQVHGTTVFNPQIVYDRGEYIIRNYNASWEAEFGNDTIVTQVNGVPVDDAIETLYEVSYIDHDFHRGKNYVWSIYPRDFGDNAIFTVENSTGYIEDVTLGVVAGYTDDPYDYPATPFSTAKYESDSIAYMYVGSFGGGIDAYADDAFTFYSELEDYDHLIIDIRGNNGGFYSKWIDGIVEPLVQETVVYTQYLGYRNSQYATQTQSYLLTDVVPKTEFSYLPPEAQTDNYTIFNNIFTFPPMSETNFTGDIDVLMDHYVFSAAEGFVNFCKEAGFATLYGTASGGDGLMIRPFNFVLPNSKLVINTASALGLDSTGHVNEEVRTQPDVFYESAFGNWTELIDFTIADLINS